MKDHFDFYQLLTLTKISGQFSSSSYAAISKLQAKTDTRLFPLALKLIEASRRRRLHKAYHRKHNKMNRLTERNANEE